MQRSSTVADRSPDLRALDRIMQELQHAEHKHPGWSRDPLRQVAVLMEEAGEALQATLNMIERREGDVLNAPVDDAILKEVAQTGAMALRYLINYEREWNR
jgi:NTP pyrophosphatase (non-canonical NTP hydrolase)